MSSSRRYSRKGFTLLELVVVFTLMAAMLMIIVATLWGAVRIERVDASTLHRIMVQSRFADQFRADAHSASEAPDALGEQRSGPDCLILAITSDRHIIYRWTSEQLERIELSGSSRIVRVLPVGDQVALRFVRPTGPNRLVTAHLVESRGTKSAKREWLNEVSAALGGDGR